jgi:hypothetical protein
MSSRHEANEYITTNQISLPLCPRLYRTKTGTYQYYTPIERSCNGSSCASHRSIWDYRRDNSESEYRLLAAACHLRWILHWGSGNGWHLHHIHAHALGGNNNVENLCLLPARFNGHMGTKGWSIDRMNEYICEKESFLKLYYDLPSNFRVESLKQQVHRCSKLVNKTILKRYQTAIA